jgi:hypothetical protein
MRAQPDSAFISVPAVGNVCGVPLAEPALRATLTVMTAGLPEGASALFLVTAHLQAESGRTADLGTGDPVLELLSYGGDESRNLSVLAQWKLSASAVERLEQIRDGKGFTMWIGVRYGLMGEPGLRTGASLSGRCGFRSPISRPSSPSPLTSGPGMFLSHGSRLRP